MPKRIRLHAVSAPGITDIWSASVIWDMVVADGSDEVFIEHTAESDCPSFSPATTLWPFAEAKQHVPAEVWDKAVRTKLELQRGQG
jgi:hypothetical protein